jgi:hypothetical protein
MNASMPSPRLRYFDPVPGEPREIEVDICIYGGTSGGVVAAIESARRGLRVALVAPEHRLGGMTSGGLGMTDIGQKDAIGGIAREFYQRVGRHYGVGMEWRFEPHVAEAVFEQWLAETEARVFRGEFLDKVRSAHGVIEALHTLSGLTVKARAFIDTSYEGDLMASADVSYTVGREGNARYGERLNGSQLHHGHQFTTVVDPYRIAGNPLSGLLPGIEDGDGQIRPGEGDHRIQAYNFRMCLTSDAGLRLPFPRPEGYRAEDHELLRRLAASGWNEWFEKFDKVRGGKTDTNNHGPVSTDFIGRNHLYPDASYEVRERIFQEHVTYQQGMMWTLANDPVIPAGLRDRFSVWGLCRDEFVSTGGWPTALYVRESRRMVSDRVMTEADCRHMQRAVDVIALGAYNMDSHHCRRLLVDGVLRNEGDVQEGVPGPYPISYRSIIPAKGQAANLFVPFCLSASHVAFGSIRMEPVFMELAQAVVVAAALCIEAGIGSHHLPYNELFPALIEAGAVLSVGAVTTAPSAEVCSG